MVSNYALYIFEREGKEIIEDNEGFATYLHTPSRREIYIVDVFVKKEFRGVGKARDYFNKIINIAKERNCDYILTSVDTYTNDWQFSLMLLETDGYKQIANKDTTIFLRKDL